MMVTRLAWIAQRLVSSKRPTRYASLDVLRHDGDSLGMDSTEVGILEETDQIRLAGLLKSHNGRALEPKVSLEILGNLPDETLEGKLADEQLGRFLVATNLTESDCAGSVSVGLLDSTSSGCGLPGSLGGQLLPRGFSSSRLPGCLLGTSHLKPRELVISCRSESSYMSLV